MTVVVDTSALLAILNGEAEAPQFKQALAKHPGSHISAASFVELCIVAGARRRDSS